MSLTASIAVRLPSVGRRSRIQEAENPATPVRSSASAASLALPHSAKRLARSLAARTVSGFLIVTRRKFNDAYCVLFIEN